MLSAESLCKSDAGRRELAIKSHAEPKFDLADAKIQHEHPEIQIFWPPDIALRFFQVVKISS